jgi:hypothetical protein
MSHPIKLSDIEEITIVIKDSKLSALNRGETSSEPILLDRGFGKPYRIINGNHRIYLARQQGKQLLAVEFVDEQ